MLYEESMVWKPILTLFFLIIALSVIIVVRNNQKDFAPVNTRIEGKLSSGMYWMDVSLGTSSQTVRLHLVFSQ